jgi:hypothetical protein
VIVLISESLLQRATATDGRILRDRVLSGFGVRLNARKRTFLVATTVQGKQFRMMLGHWPLMTVSDARSKAMDVLKQCRAGETPSRKVQSDAPVLRVALLGYCRAKGIKASSQKRYDSIFRPHFGDWLERPVTDLSFGEFSEHWSGLPAWRETVDKLGERQRDLLLLTRYTGLRRNDCRWLPRQQIDLGTGLLVVPMTKNGKPHSLPITPMMREILERRCSGLPDDAELFKGVSAEHVHSMAMRVGAPKFMLHDLRKLVATVGEKQRLGDAVLRRVMNHTAPKTDGLHRHYVGLNKGDVLGGLVVIQDALAGSMRNAHQGT